MEGLNRQTNWTVWIDGQGGWTDKQMDGGTNELRKGTDSTEWTDGVERVARRTDRADGRREQADVQRWTGRTEGRMGERTEGLNRLTKWTLSEWTGLLCFWIGFLKFGSFRFISFEKTN